MKKYIWYMLVDGRTKGDGGSVTDVMEVEGGVIFRTSELSRGSNNRTIALSKIFIPFESLKNIFGDKNPEESPKHIWKYG